MKRRWQSLIWEVASWLATRRPPRVRPADIERHLYRQQTRGMGLRMTERLRDKLRPHWLRLHRTRDVP